MLSWCSVMALALTLASAAVPAIAPEAQTGPATQNTPDTQDKPKENPPEPEAHGTHLRWQDIPKNVWESR